MPLGCHFHVEIISAMSRDSNDWTVFGVEIPALARRENSHRGRPIDGDLLLAISNSVPAQIALRDFQLAMRDAVGTGFYCYRAVEAMMQSMKTGALAKDKAAWEQLNRVLSLDRSASEKIKKQADLPRHGKESSMSDQDRAEVFQLTDEIIRRFLEYIRRDTGPLPESEFPILKT
jgi:hypothetical protein